MIGQKGRKPFFLWIFIWYDTDNGGMDMKQRQFAILQLILLEEQTIDKEICLQYQISKRTFQYDISAINRWLTGQDLPKLKRNDQGHLSLEITPLMREQVLSKIRSQSMAFHQMNDEARMETVLFTLLLENGAINTKTLCEEYEMSRNSIRKLLVKLSTELNSEEVSLVSRPKKGWMIRGDEEDIRRYFVKRFHGIFIEPTKRNSIQYLEMHRMIAERIPRWDTWIKERSFDVFEGITDRSSGRVIASLAISIIRHQTDGLSEFQPMEIPVLAESGALPKFDSLIQGYGFLLNLQDRVFCAKYLLGNRAIDMDRKVEVVFDALPKIVKIMVKDMSEIAGKPIREPERLVNSLIVHLQPTIFRIRFGIEVENKLLEQIQDRYQGYYRAARIASRPLEQHFDIKIPPEEVAFIAMHFGAFIEKQEKEHIRILLVCHEGMATVRLMQARLQEEFDAFEIVGIMSRHQYTTIKNIDADLVLATIPLKSRGIPIVTVEPLLTEKNQMELEGLLTKRKIARKNVAEQIMHAVEQYATVHQKRLLRHRIEEIVNGKRSGKLLSEILPLSRIQLGKEADTWQEAVSLAAEPLLEAGAMTEGYYLKMLENIERYRAYVVVRKFVAMPHARPEDGALDVQASLLVLKKGVIFGHPKNDPVRIVFILTAIDALQHLHALETFRKMISSEESLNRLKRMQTQKECQQWIKSLEE